MAKKIKPLSVLDKKGSADLYTRLMLARTQMVFKWDGLPETIPARELERILQNRGHVCVTKVNGKLYALWGEPGGEWDVYYRPKDYIVANPALNFNKTLRIDKDCVLILSDSYWTGIRGLCERYAEQLAENDISIRMACIGTRMPRIITAETDGQKAAADTYIKQIEDGKLSVVAAPSFVGGIQTADYSTTQAGGITQLIELEQYLKGSWFMDLGLQAQWNAKRESINSGETAQNEDSLLPLIDDMLRERQEACEKINNMFGTNITVQLASSWAENKQELKTEEKEEDIEEEPEEAENNDETAE